MKWCTNSRTHDTISENLKIQSINFDVVFSEDFNFFLSSFESNFERLLYLWFRKSSISISLMVVVGVEGIFRHKTRPNDDDRSRKWNYLAWSSHWCIFSSFRSFCRRYVAMPSRLFRKRRGKKNLCVASDYDGSYHSSHIRWMNSLRTEKCGWMASSKWSC